MNRPALGMYPPLNFNDKLKNVLLALAPKGLQHIQTMACGSCANENAFKASFFWYNALQRNGKPPSQEELNQCVMNKGNGKLI